MTRAVDITRGGADRVAGLRVLDLFSGIGAFSLGLERAGGRTVRFCEINEFCRRVLAKHWPDIPCHDDVTTMDFTEGEADVICGGFPCQDVSAAGLRAGLAGARSGLYRELVRAFRLVRPKVLILENVARLLSDGLGTVLGDLAQSRSCGWIEWDCVPASAVGAPHERDRVWIVARADRLDADGRGHGAGEVQRLGPEAAEICRCLPDAACDAADASRQQMGTAGQPWGYVGVGAGVAAITSDTDDARVGPIPLDEQMAEASDDGGLGRPSDPESLGRGPGRSRRPPDSFARIRDEARRNAADPYGARLAFREGFTRDAWEKLTPAERDGFRNVGQSIWPDEPALQGVDDGDAYWMDRIAATGNQVLPQIPELIARAIIDAETRAA